MPLQKIALIGANGRLGPSILGNLLQDPSFSVTVLNRASSKSRYPSAVNVVTIPDDASVSELVTALHGHDALVITTSATDSALQIRFADAAYQAGIKRIIPADFGSVDSANARARELVPLYDAKQAVLQHVAKLAGQDPQGQFSWTSLVCGHFLDYGLKTGLLSLYIAQRRARVFDGGDVRFSATTLWTIGAATAAILRHDAHTRNCKLYVHSVCTTQNELLAVLERLTTDGGGSSSSSSSSSEPPKNETWDVEHVSSTDWIKSLKDRLNRHPDDHELAEELVGVVGILETCWEGKEELANELLGVGDEDLEGIVQKVLDEMK